MSAWIVPPEDFQPDENQGQTWKSTDAGVLMDPVLQFGRKAPLRANLQVVREEVELNSDIGVLAADYCRTLSTHSVAPSKFNVALADFIFEDGNEGRLVTVTYPETKEIFPFQMLAFRLDDACLTTAIFSTEKSLISEEKISQMGQSFRSLKAPAEATLEGE